MTANKTSTPIDVHVWNVGHGEAIRIDVGDISIIRDFGRSRFAKATTYSISEQSIIQFPILPKGRQCDVVLSHPHTDHLSGFELFNNSATAPLFDCSYIPWYDFTNKNGFGWKVCHLLCCLIAIYSRNRKPNIEARKWFRAAVLLKTLSRKLYCIVAGAQAPNWPVQCEWLWPPPISLQEYYLSMIQQIVNETNFLFSQLEQVRGDVNAIRETANKIAVLLAPYYSYDSPVDITREQALEHLGIIDESLEHIPHTNLNERLDWRPYSRLRAKKTIDDQSIVFRLDDRGLFCSDLSESSINSMCKHYHGAFKKYALLKSAHHGSRFGSIMSQYMSSDIILHCCGPAHSSYSGPDTQYEKLAPFRAECTDWNWKGGGKWIMPSPCYNLFNCNHKVYSI